MPRSIRIRFAMTLLALATLAPLLVACVTNPATGKRQLNVLSREDEIALGNEAMAELTNGYGGELPKQSLQAYVTRVGASMTPHTEADYPSLPWEFTLLDSEVINAFALPGGKVFVTRGLASKFENEAQMAGVLGHEIGHVTAEHADKRISGQIMLALGVATAAAIAGQSDDDLVRYGVPALVGAGGSVFALKFSREEEIEADRLGMRYMSRAGYDPRGQLGVMQVLARASQGSRPPEFLSTHPYPQTRIDRIRRELQAEYSGASGANYATFEQRYRSEFRSPLEEYLSSRPSEPARSDASPARSGAAAWCGVCAARSE